MLANYEQKVLIEYALEGLDNLNTRVPKGRTFREKIEDFHENINQYYELGSLKFSLNLKIHKNNNF